MTRTAVYSPDDGGLDDRVPFLARLESGDRSALLALGRRLDFAARMILIHQHEPSSHVLFLVHGWTKVTAAAANGYEALLALRGPGDIVGESAALTGRPRSATVTRSATRAPAADMGAPQAPAAVPAPSADTGATRTLAPVRAPAPHAAGSGSARVSVTSLPRHEFDPPLVDGSSSPCLLCRR